MSHPLHCNNPAPWQHPNGTIFIVCESSALFRAEGPAGPSIHVATIKHSAAPVPHLEDAFLYTDTNEHFHLLFHGFSLKAGEMCFGRPCGPTPHCTNPTVSAHAFSPNGYDWSWGDEQPHTAQIKMQGGAIVGVATRERPKLLFNEHRQMSHLLNGVAETPWCGNNADTCAPCKTKGFGTHTVVAPLDSGA